MCTCTTSKIGTKTIKTYNDEIFAGADLCLLQGVTGHLTFALRDWTGKTIAYFNCISMAKADATAKKIFAGLAERTCIQCGHTGKEFLPQGICAKCER